MSSDTTKKVMAAFLKDMQAQKVLPSFKVEYQEVGYWYGLWLKLTRQKPPVKCRPLPASDGDTVRFKRPNGY